MHPIIDEEEVTALKDFVKDRFAVIAETYLKCADAYVDEICKAHAENDVTGVVDSAHPLKSSSGNLGLRALSDLSRRIEDTGHMIVAGEKEFSELAPMVEELKPLSDQSSAELKKYI